MVGVDAQHDGLRDAAIRFLASLVSERYDDGVAQPRRNFGLDLMAEAGVVDDSWLELILEHYRTDGFDIVRHPSRDSLPIYLGDARVDLLARKGDVVEVSVDNPMSPFVVCREFSAQLGRESALRLLDEVELLLNPSTLRSALVMALSASEAAARAVLYPGAAAFADLSPRGMLDELDARGSISPEDRRLLDWSFSLRDVLIHGGHPEDFSPDLVTSVIWITRRLLRREQRGLTIRLVGTTSVAAVRRGYDEARFEALVRSANDMLRQIVGERVREVIAAWDLAESARGWLTVILRLSDLDGTATASFVPDELNDEGSLRDRLARLWGDLLEVSSHNQLDRLRRTSTEIQLTATA